VSLVEQLARTAREGIWRIERNGLPSWSRWPLDVVRVGVMAVAGFRAHLCAIRACALTFSSMLALVPALALSLAVVRGLGWRGERLEELILKRTTVLSPEAITTVVSYVERVNFTGLGVMGGVFLLATLVSVIGSVELAFNAIWGGVPPRTLGRRVVTYLGVIVVAPVLLAVATTLTAAMGSHAAVAWVRATWGLNAAFTLMVGYAAWGIVWLLFAFLYAYVPNTRVNMGPALGGGLLAGTAWQIAQWSYIRFQFGMANYNAVYGALAQLPLLMAWLYASWMVVLFGAEIAHAAQTLVPHMRDPRVPGRRENLAREWIALSIALELARTSLARAPAPSWGGLAQLLDIPVPCVRDAMHALESAGIARSAGQGRTCRLCVPPEHVAVADVLAAVRGTIPNLERGGVEAEVLALARSLLGEWTEATAREFDQRTLRDVVLSHTRTFGQKTVAGQDPSVQTRSGGCDRD
jgi:membrane protein